MKPSLHKRDIKKYPPRLLSFNTFENKNNKIYKSYEKQDFVEKNWQKAGRMIS